VKKTADGQSEFTLMKQRFFRSLAFLIPLMYLSMQAMAHPFSSARCRPKSDPLVERIENEIKQMRKLTDPYEMPLPDEEEEFDFKMDM
jgi:hypothetical protein